MILNYFRLALRLLSRNMLLTFINVAGLSLGIASFCVLWTYSQYELRSDRFNNDYDRIARLIRHRVETEGKAVLENKIATYRTGFARAIANELTDVADLSRIVPQQEFSTAGNVFFSVERPGRDRELYSENGVAFADANVFQFFSLTVINGDPATMLAKPNTVALSERVAIKYFGSEGAVGKVIYLGDSIPLKVTGVFKDLPKNTHLVFDILLSSAEIDLMDDASWNSTESWWGYCYVKANHSIDFKVLETKINAMNNFLYEAVPVRNVSTTTIVQPIKEVVFNRALSDHFSKIRSYPVLMMLSVLAFIILGLAWINYVSLSVSVLNKRRREMATRKIIGAAGRDLGMQFLVESTLINVISIGVAMTMLQMTKSIIERLFHFYLPAWSELPSMAWLVVAGVILLGALITGIYPLAITHRLNAVELLKKLNKTNSPQWINGLVVFQYVAAITILGLVATAYLQLDFVLNRDLGIERQGIIVIDGPLKHGPDFKSKWQYFLNETLKIGGIKDATVSNSVAGDDSGIGYGLGIKGSPDQPEIGVNSNGGVDERFLPFYGVEIIAGRNFRAENPTDRTSILISKEAAARLGFTSPEAAIGSRLYLALNTTTPANVIGVFNDYHFRPFLPGYQTRIGHRGTVLTYGNYLLPYFPSDKMSIKLDQRDMENSMKAIGKLYKQLFPQETFRWVPLDENINRFYDDAKIARNQITLFTILSIAIACLGLLGMISNKIMEKTKEIGVRKILGATAYNVASVLMDTSIKQLLIAGVIGIPLSYLLANNHLQNYSARITLTWVYFTLPVLILLAIMMFTVLTVVLKATRTNPVVSLRHE